MDSSCCRALGVSTSSTGVHSLERCHQFGLKSHSGIGGNRCQTEVATNCACAWGWSRLIFTDMRSELRKEIYATDASETRAGICMSTGVTKHGLEQAMIERETGEQLTADEAAASLVHGLLRRTDHRGTDVRMDLGLPFCAKAWPRTPISSKKWSWKTVLGHPWGQRGRHINEYELQALLSLSKWHARSARNRYQVGGFPSCHVRRCQRPFLFRNPRQSLPPSRCFAPCRLLATLLWLRHLSR